MQVTSEQSFTKLKISPKEWSEMSDEEAEQFLNDVIRPERGKALKTKTTKTAAKAAARTAAVNVDDIA